MEATRQTHKWGYSDILYHDDHVCMARAVGLKGGQSSLHHHNYKRNVFIALHGFVEIWSESGKVIATIDKIRRPVFVAPPGMKHRMVFATDAILYEFYTAGLNRELDMDDIVRMDVGKLPTESEGDCEHAFLRGVIPGMEEPWEVLRRLERRTLGSPN